MSKQNNNNSKGSSDQNNSTNNRRRSNKPRSNKQNSSSNAPMPKEQKSVGDLNDSSYYYTDLTLRDQLSNYSFNQFLGRRIDLTPIIQPGDHITTIADDINPYPGNLMVVEVNPAIPPTGALSYKNQTGVNVAGLKNFLNNAADNNRAIVYGPEDMNFLILQLGELIKMVDHAKRCFGLLYRFDKRNWDQPEIFFNAMDVDFHDFKQNAADYRIQLNALIAAVDKLPIPGNIKYLEKCANWFNAIYVDETGPMPQTIMFVPYSTWVLDEAASIEGSMLVDTMVQYRVGVDRPVSDPWDHTFKRILSVIREQINALTFSSTMQNLFADMLRVNQLGRMPLSVLTGIADTYETPFLKSDEIALIVHNMVVLGPPVPTDWYKGGPAGFRTGENNVCAKTEYSGLVYNPEFQSVTLGGSKDGWWDEYEQGQWPEHGWGNPAAVLASNLLLDFFVEPTPEAKISATRLAARGIGHCTQVGAGTQRDYWISDVAVLDAYAVHVFIYSNLDRNDRVELNTLGLAQSSAWVTSMSKITDFNLYPMMYYAGASKATGGDTFNLAGQVGELNYFTNRTYSDLKKQFEAEAIGLFEMRRG